MASLTAIPGTDPGTGDKTCHLRPAQPREAAALTDLALLAKAGWGYDASFMARCRQVMTVSPEQIRRHPYYVAENHQDQPIGFYGFDLIDGLLSLDWLFVTPSWQRRGIGSQLFHHAAILAKGLGHTYFQIVSDPHAVDFYHRQGAVICGAAPSDLGPGRYLPLLRFNLSGQAVEPGSR